MSERNDREREGHLREHMIYGGDYLKSKLFQFLEKKLDFFVIFFDFFGTNSGFSRIVSNQKTCGNSGGSKQVI